MDPTQASPPSKPPKLLPMVCSRAVAGDGRYFPKSEHKGQTIYFCTDYCLNAFLDSPERFLAVHRKKLGACADPDRKAPGGKT
jgi:YHS domain-containing protein